MMMMMMIFSKFHLNCVTIVIYDKRRSATPLEKLQRKVLQNVLTIQKHSVIPILAPDIQRPNCNFDKHGKWKIKVTVFQIFSADISTYILFTPSI